MNRAIGYRPQEGWSSIILVTVLCGSLAVSLDDAQLVLGRPELTDMLLWTAIGGALAGLIGPKVGWGRWTTLAIGATAAALLTSLLVGSVLLPEGGTPGSLFRATAVSTSAAWYDLVILDRLSTLSTAIICSSSGCSSGAHRCSRATPHSGIAVPWPGSS